MVKKGVSTVIATVLMVLLVIVGIAVIWAVIKPAIDRSGNEIEGDCFSVRLEVTKCEVDLNPANAGTTYGFSGTTVKRNPGDGLLQEVKLIFEGEIYNPTNLPGSVPATSIRSASAVSTFDANVPSALEELQTRTLGNILAYDANSPTNSLSYLAGVSSSNAGSEVFIPKKVTVIAVVGEQNKLCEPLSREVNCRCTGDHCP